MEFLKRYSNSLKNRFVKDFSLPIQVVQEPIFSYAIKTLDKQFNTIEKVRMLEDVIESCGGEDGFFVEYNRVKDTLISAISETTAYQNLGNDNLDKFEIKTHTKQKNIYTMENVDKTFISLDLKKANFNVLKMLDKDLVLGFDSYDDLIMSVTKFEYFRESKYLRQVIFGNLLPKKQQRLQKWVMSQIIETLIDSDKISLESILTSSADEIVLEPENIILTFDDVSDAEQFIKDLENVLESDKRTISIYPWLRIEAFVLKSIGNRKFFVKEKNSKKVEFKGIQSYFFLQAYKHYMGEEISKFDKMFYHDGMLASYEKSIFES